MARELGRRPRRRRLSPGSWPEGSRSLRPPLTGSACCTRSPGSTRGPLPDAGGQGADQGPAGARTPPAGPGSRTAHRPDLSQQLQDSLPPPPELGLSPRGVRRSSARIMSNRPSSVYPRGTSIQCVTPNFPNASQAKGLRSHYVDKETGWGAIPSLFEKSHADRGLIPVCGLHPAARCLDTRLCSPSDVALCPAPPVLSGRHLRNTR